MKVKLDRGRRQVRKLVPPNVTGKKAKKANDTFRLIVRLTAKQLGTVRVIKELGKHFMMEARNWKKNVIQMPMKSAVKQRMSTKEEKRKWR